MPEIYTRRYEEDPLEPVDIENPLAVMVVEDPYTGDVAWATTQVVVGTGVTPILAADRNRRSFLITNLTGTQQVFVGPSNGVTAANGQLIAASAGANFGSAGKGPVFGIALTSAQTVCVSTETVQPGGDQPEAQ